MDRHAALVPSQTICAPFKFEIRADRVQDRSTDGRASRLARDAGSRTRTPAFLDSATVSPLAAAAGFFRSFDAGHRGKKSPVLVAASTVAIVAIAAAVIVVALLVWYVLPRGGRRRRTPRS